ncbi:MAG: hypothetical protein MJA84_15370 [Firmicutes bacterium]|nr:hypothetical protein [Bacillota bacterium]
MILEYFAGLLAFAGSSVLMFILVPWQRVKDSAAEGVIIGLGIAFALIYIMQNYLGLWNFNRADLINIAGIPFFLSAAWIPAVILFWHLLAQYKNWTLVLVVLLAFPLAATFVQLMLVNNNMLIFRNWNLYFTYLVSLSIHIAMLGYLYYTNRLNNLKEMVNK